MFSGKQAPQVPGFHGFSDYHYPPKYPKLVKTTISQLTDIGI
jgi:hypothetical protein